VVGGVAPWGYLALLLGVACMAGDRFFGVTSGWIRDVATAQAVQRRLQVLQFDWASESVREVLGPADGTASEAAERCLGVLRRFSEDVTELVRTETADWMVEFRTGAAPLGIQSAGTVGQRTDSGASPGRFPLPPGAGARPNMPRQRPPEPR
ncbi:membrane protein, partial [Streptomyces sp. MMG1533]|uniref:SLATT domain-containing protein n=1 Tax=Streptomyces sp. MMG1533 TaxID=1415546 RepID=UPI0006C3ECD9